MHKIKEKEKTMDRIYLFICSQNWAWVVVHRPSSKFSDTEERTTEGELLSPWLCTELRAVNSAAVEKETRARAPDLQVSPSGQGGVGFVSDALGFPITEGVVYREGRTSGEYRTPLGRGTDLAPLQRAMPPPSWRYTCHGTSDQIL